MKQTPKFVTKLFAAIDGYADIKAENDQKALNLSQVARAVIKPVIEQHTGVWMYEKNGEIFANFKLPEDAVNCAVAIQREMIGNTGLKLRIGIHTGDIKSGIGTGDIVASKIAGSAYLGGICISGKVYASVQNKTDVTAEYLEDVKPVGIEHSVRVYSLTVPGLSEPAAVATKNNHADNKSKKPSIAVLPFVNMSADPEQEYFCDGMAEGIINALSHIEDLHVIARTSSFQFPGKGYDIHEIGEKLHVDTILEGSVRKAGNKLRITAQLINVNDSYHIWSEKYDRELKDIFDIQDDISLAIVETLRGKLLKKEKVSAIKRHTDNLEAYELYLLGHYNTWNKMTEEGLKQAVDYFTQAIEKEPKYALAYAGIAEAYDIMIHMGHMPFEVTHQLIKNAVEKALEIDDTLAESHISRAIFNLHCDWDWHSMEYSLKRAIKLNPGNAIAHVFFAAYYLIMKQFDKSYEESRRALELDPQWHSVIFILSLSYHFVGKTDEAIEQCNKYIQMNPDYGTPYLSLGLLHGFQGNYDEAIAVLKKGTGLPDIKHYAEAWLAYTYGVSGKSEKAEEIINSVKGTHVRPFFLALIYAGMGKNDLVFEWFEKAFNKRDTMLPRITYLPEFDNFRSDPRFKTLLKKMNLPED